MQPSFFLACLLLAAWLLGAEGRQYTLNVPRVLLPIVPHSGVKTNFTLKSQHGCFEWTSTKPDIASVEPIFELNEKTGSRCSQRAVLTSQSTQMTKLSTIIIAKELGTGQVLRCDVFVDTISRIEITTRTRELLLEEEPERFEIQAFDDEGNMFSTIRGHVFVWSLLSDEEAVQQQAGPEAILTFVNFEDSSYSTDPVIGALETEGLRGDIILVSGLSTGTAKVQAKLVDRIWNVVTPNVVKLLVVENIMLQPSIDSYILPLSFVDYLVERKKYGRTDVVAMPSKQYRLELTNETVGRLDAKRSRVTGLVIGYTEVVLQDKNMLHTPATTKPTAGIHVVPPHHLGFSIAPGGVWVLEVEREYTISVQVYDHLNHRILITENILLETVLPSEFLLSHFSSVNGSFHTVKAVRPGTTTLHSTLSKIQHPDTGKLHNVPVTIAKQQSLVIYEPVRVQPARLALLWDPATELRYQHTLKASGGSGGYVWSCDPEGVVGVSNLGTVTAIAQGRTTVKAADSQNSAHFDTTEVVVVPPSEMAFLASRVEAEVGTRLLLPVQIKGFFDDASHESLPFPDCRQLKLGVTLSDTSVFNVSSDSDIAALSSLPPGACATIATLALKPGHTKLTISYRLGVIFLEASITIAAYPPLVSVDPATIAVVTLGSSKDFVFEGGPAPWVLDRSKYTENLSAEQPAQIAVYPKTTGQTSSYQHVYRVVCRKLGEQVLNISVGNGLSLKNQFPVNEVASARISCALPVSMVIIPVVGHVTDCPLLEGNHQNFQFPVRGGQQLDLEVVVYDAESRPFNNFTSLHWHWGSSDKEMLADPSMTSLTHHDSGAIMALQLSQLSGSVILSASSTHHSAHYLTAEKIHFDDPFSPGVNYSITLLLRRGPEIFPPSLLLLNHPDARATLNIVHGSGHFRVSHVTKPNLHPVATLDYIPELGHISLQPLRDGQVHVTVRDLCLEADSDATAVVTVASLHSIRVGVADKVQVGKSLLAYVEVLDRHGDPFSTSQLEHMHLLANPNSAHIEVSPATNSILSTLKADQVSHTAIYVVSGVLVGASHLTFNATTASGRIIQSLPEEIQVFDALALQPKYVTLLPTASFQVRSTGGPRPQSSIAYSVDNRTVASVDGNGLIDALVPGSTTITGKAQAEDPASGHMTSYSEDVVHVRVLQLTGIRLYVPSTKLLSGVEVAVYADGMDDVSPFSFASALPGLSFHWSATNMDVLSLVSVYEKAGVSLQEEQDFSARLRTRNPGQGTIRLTAKCSPGVCDPDRATFTDQVQIQVFPRLELVRPVSGRLLLPHNGHAQIITNRDGVSRMSYEILRSVGDCAGKQDWVSVSANGEISTGSVNGHAVVMVTSHEEDLGLNQTAMVHVEVRPIASISLSPISLAQATPTSKLHAFPLGYSAEFLALLHDNVGRVFDFAEISLVHRLNRFDIVGVSPGTTNSTYVIKAAKQGNVILNVRVAVLPHVSDFIRIQVRYAILPSLATVHLGSKICFATHLTSESGTDLGLWSAGDEGVIGIQSESGIAVAMSTGRAVVYHKKHNYVDTHTEITVSKVSEVVFSTEYSLPLFTNARRRSEIGVYRIPVQFLHSSGGGGEFSLLQLTGRTCAEEVNATVEDLFIQQVPFECVLELVDSGTLLHSDQFVTPLAKFDSLSGESYCELAPVETSQAMEALSVRDSLSLSLRVRVFDSSHTYEVASPKLGVPFLPAFFVSRRSVVLTSVETATEVFVTGLARQLQALQVTSPYPFSVVQTTSTSTSVIYRISLIDYYSPPQENFTAIPVSFSSSLAKQDTVITVSYFTQLPEAAGVSCLDDRPSEGSPSCSSSQPPSRPVVGFWDSLDETTMYALVIIITFVAVLIGAIVICLAVSKGSSRPQGGFQSHLLQSPQQAFLPGNISGLQTPTVQRGSPVLGQSGGSAFTRPSFSPSPQHGLFSQ